MTIEQRVQLADGNLMPLQGLGLYKITDEAELEQSIKTAWGAGYRLLDTAQMYENEVQVGQALTNLQLPREEMFLTTKISEDNQGYDATLSSLEDSLKRLQVDYVDLLLVHWPVNKHFFETWRAFERLHEEGLAKSIGVSNYSMVHLQYLATRANEMPVVDQIEIHPTLSQKPMFEFAEENQIVLQAWSPLGRGRNLDNEVIQRIAEKVGKTPAQVILRWHMQNGHSFIPKSSKPERIIENAAIYDFELDERQMKALNGLNRFKRISKDPEFVYERGNQYPMGQD